MIDRIARESTWKWTHVAVGALAFLAASLSSSPVLAQRSSTVARAGTTSRCPDGIAPFASPFCAELVAVPDLAGVRGMLELRYVRSPFGVAVAPDGRLRHALVARIQGLPPAESLGAYSAYVAWGYDVTMANEVRLGVVRDGVNALGELPYERFRVIVSAEASPDVPTRRGRLVLRATSPNALLLAHRDAMLPATSAPLTPEPTDSAGGEHGEHGGATGHAAWPMPPVDPRIAPSAMQHGALDTAPWLPSATLDEVPDARPRELLDLNAGDTLRLTASAVRRTIGAKRFVTFGYNGQYPGPLIRVRQGGELVVRFHNALELPSTVHWHGLRLDNRYDGVPHFSQHPVAPGDSFDYRIRFPDAGIYWYHPHVREDIQQELGLYGNILVARRGRARVPVQREEVLALDDILLGDREPFPFGRDTAAHALMGRFGNVMLVNGEPRYALAVRPGDVVRFYLTNVANARIFNLRFHGARVKLIGSDVGDFEREEWVESVVIAPAERYIVEARFDSAGQVAITNDVQWLDHMRGTISPVSDTLGVVTVRGARTNGPAGSAFARLARNPEVTAELARLRGAFARPVDHTLTLGLRLAPRLGPSIIAMLVGVAIPVDWNDAMPMMNWSLTARDVAWTMRDESGRENMEIDWSFKVGDLVRIRLVNDPTVTHAMAHPIHFHGQRFLVIARDGVPNDNLAWKDTAVLPAGETMDILLEASNPGRWMMHCHVAEHLGTGMMAVFTVTGA